MGYTLALFKKSHWDCVLKKIPSLYMIKKNFRATVFFDE